MDKPLITDNMILNACSYLPVARKKEIVDSVSRDCIQSIRIKLDESVQDVPLMYMENAELKARCLLTIFLNEYLNVGVETLAENPYAMPLDRYDMWSETHVYNTIERFKGRHEEFRVKVFDIMYDFKELKRLIDGEISSMLRVMNDPVGRMMMAIGRQITPESLKAQAEQFTELKKRFEGIKRNG